MCGHEWRREHDCLWKRCREDLEVHVQGNNFLRILGKIFGGYQAMHATNLKNTIHVSLLKLFPKVTKTMLRCEKKTLILTIVQRGIDHTGLDEKDEIPKEKKK